MGEEGEEVGAPREEATNPSTEVGVDLPIMKGIDPSIDRMIEGIESIESGMPAKRQDLAQANLMRRRFGKNIKRIWGIIKRGSIETPQGTSQRSMKTEKEPEAPVLEERDPIEGI